MAGIYEGDSVLRVAELGDTIFVAESTKFPFSRLVPRGKKPVAMLAEWPVKAYPDRAFGAQVDGTDIATFNHTNRTRIAAYGEWMMTEGWMVSRLKQITATAGVPVGKEKAEQAGDDAIILAGMIERQLLSNQDTQQESMPGTPFQSRGAFSWLSSTAQTTLPVNESFRPASACHYTGALASLSPTAFETMLEAAASAKKGAVDLTGYCGIKLKRQMSLWPQLITPSASETITTRWNHDASDKRLMQVVNFFEFDAGKVQTFPSWYLRCDPATGETTDYTTRSGLFVDLSMWELCWYDPPATYTLPAQSGGPRGYHDAVYILKAMNPLGQMAVETKR